MAIKVYYNYRFTIHYEVTIYYEVIIRRLLIMIIGKLYIKAKASFII